MVEPGLASPEAAWREGIAQAQLGKLPAALRWLERATRLAPGDPRIAQDLANIRLQAGGTGQLDQAEAAFIALSDRYDAASCWLGLLAARRLKGDDAGAASALHALLSRHCVPEDQGFAEVALAVALAAGWPGWCGIDAAGFVHMAARAGEITAVADGLPVALAHLDAAPECGVLILQSGVKNLLGSPLTPVVFQRCEGVVEATGLGLEGWVSRPAAPLTRPLLVLADASGQRRDIALQEVLAADADAPLTARYGFTCPAAMLLDLTPPLRVVGPDGVDIFGSPLNPSLELASLITPAAHLGPPNRRMPARAGLQIVVPVHGKPGVTQPCLLAAYQALPPGAGLIVVDDASPEPELRDWLDDFCRNPGIRLLRHASNLGFASAANTGMAVAQASDVLLLNSDTLLPPGAVERLLAAVYTRAEIGSATPFSNEATICSYPARHGGNKAPDLAGTVMLNALAAKANGNGVVEIPTGIGFCLLMRHDCIAATGRFRPELFAQGYGEEVDWCLRARHRGYRHVAATGAFVAHVSGVSFGAPGRKAAARALNERNNRLLMRLYPGYRALIQAHFTADPLAPARRRLDVARFKAGRRKSAVLLISHNHGGGVAHRIAHEMRQIEASGARPILLRPAVPQNEKQPGPYPAELSDGTGLYPNLRCTLPEDGAALLALLQGQRISHAVLHHGLGHHAGLRRIAEQLGCPQDIVIHDYASFCPRVHLIGPENHYCGEPDVQACAACVAQAGDATREGLGLQELLARSRREFAGARRLYAPSADVSRRIARHFPDSVPAITPWEDDGRRRLLRPPAGDRRRIAVIGGIGLAKGYDVLLACAQDAQLRGLNLEFIIAGSSAEDEKLLATGRIFITGAYQREALPQLLETLDADLAFIPSIWPETWCFTLSEAWAAGLYTLAFDLGAQAERIEATRRGGLLPLGLPAPRINDALLSWQPA